MSPPFWNKPLLPRNLLLHLMFLMFPPHLLILIYFMQQIRGWGHMLFFDQYLWSFLWPSFVGVVFVIGCWHLFVVLLFPFRAVFYKIKFGNVSSFLCFQLKASNNLCFFQSIIFYLKKVKLHDLTIILNYLYNLN
jgi:hypothetical protein